MQSFFKLHHHKHTGKLLHHRHTSYPALIGLVIVAGFLVFMTGRVAHADDLMVSARVAAPIPSGTPVFTAPTEGFVTNDPQVDFAGTCPVITPAVIIALYDGPTLIGSGGCAGDGTFAITATISQGQHTIVATVVTMTGDNGNSSAPLHITYSLPITPTQPTTPTTPGSPKPKKPVTTPAPSPASSAGLAIVPDKPFITFAVGKPTNWTGHFEGGTPPYRVTIVWGDDDVTKKEGVLSDPQSFTHIYNRSRIYTLIVGVTDANGDTLSREYAAMTLGTAPVNPGISGNIVAALDSFPNDPTVTVLTLYTSLVGLLIILWRYEFLHFRNAVGIPLHYSWNDRLHHRNAHRSKR